MRNNLTKTLRRSAILTIAILLVMSSVSFAFAGEQKLTEYDPGDYYTHGIVIVGFVDSVTEETEVFEAVDKYGLSIESLKFYTGHEDWYLEDLLPPDYQGHYVARCYIPEGMTEFETVEMIEAAQDPRISSVEMEWFYLTGNEGGDEYYPDESVEYDYDWSQLIPGEDYEDGEIIVTFSLTIPDEKAMEQIAEFWGCSVKKVLSFSDKFASGKTALLSIDNGYSVPEAIKVIEYDHRVRYATPNCYFRTSGQDDEGLAFNSRVINQWHITKIGADIAWNYAACDHGVTVAVVDTGVDWTHPDLAANVLTNYAWDAVNNCALTSPNCLNSHGTHVAGIISAVSGNGIGIDGVSHDANIIPVNVFTVRQNGDILASTVDIFNGLKHLYLDTNCSTLKVINMSLYGSHRLIVQEPQLMNVEELIDALAYSGIITVCCAGNTEDNNAVYPSDYNSAISVIATDSNDTKWSGSSYGWAKDICAPGVSIWSTLLGNSYGTKTGTSMASPMVAGTVALMFAANPNLTLPQIRYILHDTAVDLGDPGQDEIYGWGRLNTLDAVLRARDGYWDRMYGSDRYFTMQNISCEGWEDNSCDAVVLALGSAFPDALAGTGLAGTLDAPIILTGGSTLSPQAATEISRLGASTVYICGGTGAISDTVKASVEALPGVQQVIRLGGTDRFATCYSIYQAGIGDWSDTLIVGTGMSSADVLSISPYAFANESPVFLVNGQGNMTTNMKSAISGGAFSKAVIVGSTSIVSTETENYLKTYLGNNNVIRLFGNDRYKTSSQIAKWESGELSTVAFQPSTVLDYAHCTVVNGVDTSFADALSGGAFAGHKGSVMLLAQDLASDSNYTVTNNIAPHIYDVEKGYIIGGPSILSEAFEMYLEGLRMAS